MKDHCHFLSLFCHVLFSESVLKDSRKIHKGRTETRVFTPENALDLSNRLYFFGRMSPRRILPKFGQVVHTY